MEYEFPTGKLATIHSMEGDVEGGVSADITTIILHESMKGNPLVAELEKEGYKVSFSNKPKGDGTLQLNDGLAATKKYSTRGTITNPNKDLLRTWIFQNKIRSLAITNGNSTNPLDLAQVVQLLRDSKTISHENVLDILNPKNNKLLKEIDDITGFYYTYLQQTEEILKSHQESFNSIIKYALSKSSGVFDQKTVEKDLKDYLIFLELGITNPKKQIIDNTDILSVVDVIRKHLVKNLQGFMRQAYLETLSMFEKYIGPGKLFTISHLGRNISLLRENNPLLMKEFIVEANKKGFYTLNNAVIAELSAGKHYKPFHDPFDDSMLSPDLIQEIQNELIRTIDGHNMYLDIVSRRVLESVAKNYSMYLMYKISSDPINAQLSLSSVDAMTNPIQKIGNSSPTAAIVKSRTAGSFPNTAESIVENLVGKEGIGICATGMKAYFGLTAYTNYVTNYGSQEQKDRLKFQVEFGGKTYTTIANINAQLEVIEETFNLLVDGLSLVTTAPLAKLILETLKLTPIDAEYADWYYQLLTIVVNLLAPHARGNFLELADVFYSYLSARTLEDAALSLSAMLSLATDNAKELLLSKLNAGTKTIGMYLYGLSIGIPFLEIATRMMSPIGNTILEIMSGNSFTGLKELNNLSDAFDFIELGPKSAMARFKDTFFIEEPNSRGEMVKKPTSVAKIMIKLLLQYVNPQFLKEASEHSILAAFAWNPNLSLREKLQIIKSIPLLSGNINRKWLSGLMKEMMIHYLYQVDTIQINENYYRDIKKLAEGALEMRVLGSFFSLNQGLKSKPDELKNQVSKIENCIADRVQAIDSRKKRNQYRMAYRDPSVNLARKASKTFPFNLMRFVTDDWYALKVILEYEAFKLSFNILDSIYTVPHFRGYLNTLATAFGSAYYISPKFRFSYNKGRVLTESLGIYSSKDTINVYKGLNLFYSDHVRRRWMLAENITIVLPAESKFMDNTGKIGTLKSDTPINLGTKSGEATFKMYMEDTLIPNLKHSSFTTLRDNLFISKLVPLILTKTVSHNPIVYYTLPINMMPHGDTEQALFDSYKASFNLLANEKITIGNLAYPLRDLFFYYGLIAHYGRPGLQSLMPIFLNLLNIGALKSFHQFESTFEENIPEALDSEIESYAIPYASSLWNATSDKVYAELPYTLQVIKWVKLHYVPKDWKYEGGRIGYEIALKLAGAINEYLPDRNNLLVQEDIQNYMMGIDFADSVIEDLESGFKIGDTFVSYHAVYDNYGNCMGISYSMTESKKNEDGTIKTTTTKNSVDLKKYVDLLARPTVKRDGLIVTDTALIEKYLKHIINCGG